MELSGRRSSRQVAAARAAASTRLRIVSVPTSCDSASFSPKASFTLSCTRPGLSDGRTSRFLKTSTRRLARSEIASSCNIESALMAQLGFKVDHRKISVAQVADVRPIEALQGEAVSEGAQRRAVVFKNLQR